LMERPGNGTGVNTTPGSPYVTPYTVSILMIFSTPTYTMDQLDITNFNPFLIVDYIRGQEIHLPDFPPSGLVDPTYFGMGQDDSKPSQHRYYKTASNLPWAINLYQHFDYPIEETCILDAYYHFVDWVTSNGQLYPDWYMDKPGYRNPSAIY
ncbi:MAG: LruC domain-containing protein, partial [Bacteroidetes bacterium]